MVVAAVAAGAAAEQRSRMPTGDEEGDYWPVSVGGCKWWNGDLGFRCGGFRCRRACGLSGCGADDPAARASPPTVFAETIGRSIAACCRMCRRARVPALSARPGTPRRSAVVTSRTYRSQRVRDRAGDRLTRTWRTSGRLSTKDRDDIGIQAPQQFGQRTVAGPAGRGSRALHLLPEAQRTTTTAAEPSPHGISMFRARTVR